MIGELVFDQYPLNRQSVKAILDTASELNFMAESVARELFSLTPDMSAAEPIVAPLGGGTVHGVKYTARFSGSEQTGFYSLNIWVIPDDRNYEMIIGSETLYKFGIQLTGPKLSLGAKGTRLDITDASSAEVKDVETQQKKDIADNKVKKEKREREKKKKEAEKLSETTST